MKDREAAWAAWMVAAQQGDAVAYRRLLEQIAPALRRVVWRRLAQLPTGTAGFALDAEDIVQDTLIAIHAKRQTWDASRPFLPWLRAVAEHKLLDAARYRRRASRHLAPVTIDELADTVSIVEEPPFDDAGRRHELAVRLAGLPPRQAAVLRGLALEGRTVRDLARALGVGEGAVRIALHRALKALRRQGAKKDG